MLFCAVIIALILIIVMSFVGLISDRFDVFFSMYGIVLAFFLGISFTEFVRIKGDEDRARIRENDLLFEAESILSELQSESAGLLYSATWLSIKSTGMPDRIQPELQKALADLFLYLEVYNDEIRHLEDYSILTDAQQEKISFFERRVEMARRKLKEAASSTLILARDLDIQWK